MWCMLYLFSVCFFVYGYVCWFLFYIPTFMCIIVFCVCVSHCLLNAGSGSLRHQSVQCLCVFIDRLTRNIIRYNTPRYVCVCAGRLMSKHRRCKTSPVWLFVCVCVWVSVSEAFSLLQMRSYMACLHKLSICLRPELCVCVVIPCCIDGRLWRFWKFIPHLTL